MRETSYITVAAHYVHALPIYLTVCSRRARGSAASSSAASVALGRWSCHSPLFQIMQFASGLNQRDVF
jgi:hypothetical protein